MPEAAPRNIAGSMRPPRLLNPPCRADLVPEDAVEARSEDGYQVEDAAVAPLMPLQIEASRSEVPETEGAPRHEDDRA